MAGRLNARKTLEIAERRTRARTLVTTPIYVDLNHENGGLIFNLSESGLALTTARSLPGDNRLIMRIQMPDSRGWIAARGEIAWRGKSNKEAGVRFIGLAEEVLQQISNWIIAETLGDEHRFGENTSAGMPSQIAAVNERIKNWIATEVFDGKVHSEGVTSAPLPGLSENARQRLRSWIFLGEAREDSGAVKDKVPAKVERPAGISSERAPSSSISDAGNTPLALDKEKKNVVVHAKTDTRLHEKDRVLAKPAFPQAVPDMLRAPGTAERRVRPRALFTPPIYVDIEKVNGGLISDMSQDGIALTAAKILSSDRPVGMRIQLPDDDDWIEATGQIVWKSRSGKTAGVRFAGLPKGARQRIGKWLAEENSRVEAQAEGAPLLRREQPHANEASARTPKVPRPEPANPNAVAEESKREPNLSEASAILSELAEIVAEPIPQQTPAHSDQETDKRSFQARERRIHPRSRIRPISYLELGADNGGVLLNIGEGGLAVNTATPLSRVDMPSIRIQFTGSQDWIEVSGQLAWIAESRKEAGIRFIELTEEARQKIASRISLGELQRELPAQSVKKPEGRANRAEKPEVPSIEIPIPVAEPTARAVLGHLQAPVASRPAATSMHAAKAPETAVASVALHPKSLKSRSKPKPMYLFHPIASEGRTKTLRRFAAMFVMAAVTAAAIGWVVAAPAVRNEVITFIAKNAETAGKPTEEQKSFPEYKSAIVPALGSESKVTLYRGIEPRPADRPANSSETQPAPIRPQMSTAGRRAVKPTVSVPARRAGSPTPKMVEHTSVPDANPTVESARSQAVESSTSQPTENTPAATNSTASIPSGTRAPEAKESFPLPGNQPVAPAGPIWSVTVSTDPYPSIRIPAKVSLEKAAPRNNLRIGGAISRAEPVYPEAAKRQGIEGTVKLHIIVGRDGAVQSVELTSGTVLLAKAAESAVREWHYAQTLLGGQPVETEQDIVVRFKLVSPSNSKN